MSSKSNSESVSSAEFDLKHRVTGAAVLLFLGALVLPWLLGPPSEASKVELAAETQTVSEIEPADIISDNVRISGGSVDDVEETVYISKITPLDAKGNSDLQEAAQRAAESASERVSAGGTENAGGASSDDESLALLAIASEQQQKLDQQSRLAAEQEKRDQEALDKKAASEAVSKNTLAKSKETSQDTVALNRAQREKELQAALVAETESLNAKANKVDVGWVVQVGLFTEKNRALALISELKRKGFNASSSVVDTNRGKNTGTRVWLGPFAKRVSAINEQKRLKAKAAKDGFIRVYP